MGHNKKGLLVIDATGFHKTKDVFDALDKHGINRAMIPSGLTPLLQPLDTHINKSIKQYLSKAYNEYIERIKATNGDFDGWNPSKKRIMLTHIVVRSIEMLNNKNPNLVAKSFVDCSISIHPDGSQDYKIRLKGINWREIDFSRYQNADNTEIINNHVEPKTRESDSNINELSLVYNQYTVAQLKAFYKARQIYGYSK